MLPTCAPTSRPCPTSRTSLAERKALDHALGFPHFAIALSFLVEWKELRYAARLVLERSREIDGNLYFVLDPAAKALEGKQPLAAALLRRAMIEDTLEGAKATRYRHAARHLLECRALEPGIGDHGSFETHDAFVARLRARHGRKTGFWSQVDGARRRIGPAVTFWAAGPGLSDPARAGLIQGEHAGLGCEHVSPNESPVLPNVSTGAALVAFNASRKYA